MKRLLTTSLLVLLPSLSWAQVLETIPNEVPITLMPTTATITAVDVEGDIMVVGVSSADNAGTNTGAVYVLGRNVGGTNAWGVLRRLESAVPDSLDFGHDVSLDGDTLVVSGSQPINTLDKYASAYVFSRNQGGPNQWGEVTNFTVARVATAAFATFFMDVDLDGDTLAIGTPYTSGTDGDNREGRVDIYARNQGGANMWGAITRLSGTFSNPDDYFGWAIDLDADTLIASAPRASLDGSVEVFERDLGGPNNWGSKKYWTGADITGCAVTRCALGREVALVANTVVVTTTTSAADSGAVDILSTVSSQVTRIVPSDGTSTDVFGRDIKLDGDTLYVGARKDDDNAQNSGSVYVFERDAVGDWNELKKLQAPNPAADDNLGWRLDADGATVVLARRQGVLVNGPAANFAPQALPGSVSTSEDVAVSITLTGMDTEPLTFTLVDMPGLGSLSGTAPDLTYTPTPNIFGQDTFTFVVSDGVTTSAPATVTVDITSVNDAPTALALTRAMIEGASLNLTLSGDDLEGDALTFRVDQAPSSGSLSGTSPNLTYTPDPGFVGQDTFTYVSNDGQIDSDPATVTITVNAAQPNNQAPTASGLDVEVVAGMARTLTLMGSDPDGDGLTFTIVDMPQNGRLEGDAPSITYTANDDYVGQDTFTFEVSDGALTSAQATVTLRVTAKPVDPVENQAPSFTAPAEGTQWEATVGEASMFQASGTDPDQDALTFTAVGLPPGATLDASTGALSWTPESPGSFGVVLSLSDGQAEVTRNVTLVATQGTVDPVDPVDPVEPIDTSVPDEGCACASTSGHAPRPGWLGVFGLLLLGMRGRRRDP